MTEADRAEILGELGLAELALAKYREAAEHLAERLELGRALSTSMQRRFEAGQARADAHVARVYIGVSPADAEVFVDDQSIGSMGPIHRRFVDPASTRCARAGVDTARQPTPSRWSRGSRAG